MRPQTGRSSGPTGPALPSSPSRSGGARRLEKKPSSSRTQKRRQRRQRHLQYLCASSATEDAKRAVRKSLRGNCSRQRQRAEEWKRRQPTAPRRGRSQDEAPLPRPARQHEDTGTTVQPQAAQEKTDQLIKIERVTGPVAGQCERELDWRMLKLGISATPPVCEQESEQAHTVAVPSQHRDGLLLRVPVRCCGHEFICLIDCGASRCYLDSQTCLQLGLQPVAENATLELGDGTRVPSKGCIERMTFTMESRTFSQNFTVTELMTGVDMVLGMTWLEQVNPLINWGSHTMYVRDQNTYYPITGVPADKDTKIGTVKHIEIPKNEENDQAVQYMNSLETISAPQFWEYHRDNQQWRSTTGHEIPASDAGNKQQASNDDKVQSSKFVKRKSNTPRGIQQTTVRSTTSQR